jgi:hypothetical protein
MGAVIEITLARPKEHFSAVAESDFAENREASRSNRIPHIEHVARIPLCCSRKPPSI